MNCPKCGFKNAEGIKFCGDCGANLIASNVAAPVPDNQSLINRFLTPQLSHKILATRGKIEGERRQVTALFVDIKGYTSLSEAIGEEAIYRLMERMYEVMITAVYNEEGSVQKLTGDGIFALFGAPVALEDAPLRACRAGLAIQQKMKALGDELMKEQNIRPLARIGIHTGPVVIGTVGTDLKMEFTALGDTVNLASRMESISEPGTVYISEATQALAGPYIKSRFVGEKQIKGKAELQKVYRIDGLKSHAVRFDVSLKRGLTPLVGRTKELDVLQEYCDIAYKGTTLLAQVIGEPGIGKSRIVHELHQRFQEKGIFYLRSNCTSFGKSTSFLPFIDVVKSLFLINDGDDQEVIGQKIRQGLELGEMQIEAKPFLLALLGFEINDDAFRGLDAKLIGDRTRGFLIGLLRSRSRISPMVLTIEDLHWIDPASENLIIQIITEEDRLPLLLLCTTRPAYQAPWSGLTSVKELKLEPLSLENTIDMVQDILGSAVDEGLSRVIVEKTGCNPLYTEEMTRYLLESGGLKRTEKTAFYELIAGKVNVPSTILDLLQTRVDRLEEGPKALLQTAAVIGQRFSPELARRVSGADGSFEEYLQELERLGLIFRESVGDSVEFRFKHALLQDVVYDNLLKPRRERLHQAIAETIEMLYPNRLNEWSETLAFHWSNTQNIGKAVRYIAMVGEKNMRVYSLEVAHQQFKQAIDLIASTPGCVDEVFWADVVLNWAQLFQMRADMKSMTAALEPYLTRFEALGDKRRLSSFLAWLGVSHVVAGRGAVSKPILERAKDLAEEINDDECIMRVSNALAWLYVYWLPYSVQADALMIQYSLQSLEKAEKLNNNIFIQDAYMLLTVQNIQRSRFSLARWYGSKMQEHGQKNRDDRSLAIALWSLGFCNIFEERYEEALACGEQALKLSAKQGEDLDMNTLCGNAVKGGALALKGNVDDGLKIMLKTEREMLAREFLLPLSGVEIPLGAVMAMAGQMAKGVAYIKNFMKYWASLGNFAQPVWGHVFLSEIYLQIAFGKKPPFAVILKNFGFIMLNAPFAQSKARYHLEEVVLKSREYNMPGFLSKALYGLGVLAQAKKQHKEARSYFEEALKVAEKSELSIAEKVRAALSAL